MMTPRPRRRGYALMLVMLEMVLLTALWGIANRQLMTTVRFLNQFGAGTASASANNDGYRPLARALSLLETGDPPDGGSGFYTCNATILTATGPAYFTITYLNPQPGGSGSSAETWTVTSTQQQSLSATQKATWDTMPSTFGK